MVNQGRNVPAWMVASLLVTGCGEPMSKEQRAEMTCKDKILSYSYAKGFIKDRLKSPSSAEFPPFSQVQYSYVGLCKHRIRGHVDAQNSFGAQIRNRFDVTVRYDKSNQTYYLENLAME